MCATLKIETVLNVIQWRTMHLSHWRSSMRQVVPRVVQCVAVVEVPKYGYNSLLLLRDALWYSWRCMVS